MVPRVLECLPDNFGACSSLDGDGVLGCPLPDQGTAELLDTLSYNLAAWDGPKHIVSEVSL